MATVLYQRQAVSVGVADQLKHTVLQTIPELHTEMVSVAEWL
jgi:hypothetical protein